MQALIVFNFSEELNNNKYLTTKINFLLDNIPYYNIVCFNNVDNENNNKINNVLFENSFENIRDCFVEDSNDFFTEINNVLTVRGVREIIIVGKGFMKTLKKLVNHNYTVNVDKRMLELNNDELLILNELATLNNNIKIV